MITTPDVCWYDVFVSLWMHKPHCPEVKHVDIFETLMCCVLRCCKVSVVNLGSEPYLAPKYLAPNAFESTSQALGGSGARSKRS